MTPSVCAFQIARYRQAAPVYPGERMPTSVRLGVVGAGGFSKNRMLPNFVNIPGADVLAVANRTRESGEAVAEQFGIAHVETDWRAVVEARDIDAVFVGTPPSAHREIVLAALAAGKHVLCQTRIARSAAEAREMQSAAQAARGRGIRSMLVPPAPWYRGSRFVEHLIESGFIGKLRQVIGFNTNASFADPSTPLSGGRNDLALYGRFNAMQLGLSYDVMRRWTGSATSVVAQRASFVPQRPLTPGGPIVDNPYPDAVTVLAETTSGANAVNMLNYAVYHGESRMELFGENGTVVYRLRGDSLVGAKAGEKELAPLAIPAELDNPWRVEEEFVQLVRGEIDEPSFTFEDGVANMDYLEAAYYAATEGRRVTLQ
jgi:predicted dehydrogenase